MARRHHGRQCQPRVGAAPPRCPRGRGREGTRLSIPAAGDQGQAREPGRSSAYPRHRRAELLLLLAAAIWGFAFVAQRVGAAHLGPFAFNGTRFVLGALSLLPLVAVVERRASRRPGEAPEHQGRSWRAVGVPGVVAGSVLFAASLFQQLGMGLTTAGKGGFITGLYVVIVPLLGIALGHRAPRRTWTGALLGVAGLYLLGVNEDFTIARGDLLVLVCAVLFAVHILVIDRYTALDALRLSVVQFAVCGAENLVAALAFEAEPFGGLTAALVPVLYGGLGSVGVAYTLQVVAQKDAAPSRAAIILAMESVFAAIGGALLLGETMSARGYAGCALVLVGIVVSQTGSLSPAEPAPARSS